MLAERNQIKFESKSVKELIDIASLDSETIYEAFFSPDKEDRYGTLSIFFKGFTNYIVLGVGNKDSARGELVAVFKVFADLINMVNPLILRSVTGRRIRSIDELSPTEMMEVFFEVFSDAVSYNNRRIKFFVDNKNKNIVTGTLELDRYGNWLRYH